MNILCLGTRVVAVELVKDLLQAFLKARFNTEERFVRRLEKVLEIERAAHS